MARLSIAVRSLSRRIVFLIRSGHLSLNCRVFCTVRTLSELMTAVVIWKRGLNLLERGAVSVGLVALTCYDLRRLRLAVDTHASN